MADKESPATRFGVVGDPINHSLSPNLHRAAYQLLGTNWTYDRNRVPAGTLADFVHGLNSSWAGLSVTMPLKVEALNLADTVDETSKRIGAANTLLISRTLSGQTISAYNTDVQGLTNALLNTGWELEGPAWIFGGGATARAALLALAQLDISQVNLLVRNPDRAQEVLSLANELDIEFSVYTPADIAARTDLRFNSLIINTLPYDAEISNLNVFQHHFSATTRLYQVSYGQGSSTIVNLVEAQNGAVAFGLSMLMEQALLQLRLFNSGDVRQPLPRELEIIAAMQATLSQNK